MNPVKLILTMLVVAVVSLTAHSQQITYIANSGVMVENNGNKVLIDALSEPTNVRFASPSPEVIDALVKNQAPYHNINLFLWTHVHADHFDPQVTVDFLNSNKSVKMISPVQVLDSMRESVNEIEQVKDRTIAYPWTKGWKASTQGNISVRSIYSLHTGKKNFKIQNLMHLVQIGDKKVLHIGDTQMELDHFKNLRLVYEDIDVAIVPFWYMSSLYGAELLKDYIGAKKYIGVHYPVSGSLPPLDKAKAQFPNSIVFTTLGQKTSF